MATTDEEKKASTNQRKAAIKEPEITPTGTPKPSKTWCYYGPTIMKGKLKKGSCWITGLPDFAKDVYEKHYQVQELFVPLAMIAEINNELFDRDSVASFYYRELEEMVKRGEI